MSIRCITAVINYPIQDMGFKATLLALANRANQHSYCWPSLSTLEKDSGATRRTVIRKLALAEELGVIQKNIRANMSTIYEFRADFLAKYAEVEKVFAAHFEHSTKEVNPEPDFLNLLEPSGDDFGRSAPSDSLSTPSDRGAYPSDTVSYPSDTVTPKPKEEPKEEPSFESKGHLQIRNETLPDEFHRRWNEIASEHRIAKCIAMDDNMKRKVLGRLEGFALQGEDSRAVMDKFFSAILRSPFLLGRIAPSGNRTKPFRLSIAWALVPANFGKIYNNSYDGDIDDQGHDISGPRAVGPTMQAVSNIQARLHAEFERRRGSGSYGAFDA